MTYQSTNELLAILDQIGHRANKKLGQNFLVHPAIIEKIIAAAALQANDEVIEIGPGLGVLTIALLAKAKHLTGIELDKTLYEYLQTKLCAHKNITLLNLDALQFTPPDHDYKLIANIPYYITSPLITHFLRPKKGHAAKIMVLLTQKEVAQKICALPGDHTILSLQTQLFGTPKIMAIVPAGNFYPAPKVDSAILRIEAHSAPVIENSELFFKIIHVAFGQKRKMLSKALAQIFQKRKEEIELFLQTHGINPQIRPQELSLENWKTIVDNQCK